MGAIWTRSQHQQFSLKVGGPSLDGKQFAASWEAYSVVIANRTNQHLHLPDINWWVPPGVVGQVMPLPALMQATAKFEPPPGITDAAPNNGQIATLDYFAEELPPYPGTSVSTASATTAAASINPGQVVPEYQLHGSDVNEPLVYLPARQPEQYTPFEGNLLATSTTTIADPAVLWPNAPSLVVFCLKKVSIASNVAVTNKVQLLDENRLFHSVILPANHQPYVYEWAGIGFISTVGNSRLRFYTDNAGLFDVNVEVFPKSTTPSFGLG